MDPFDHFMHERKTTLSAVMYCADDTAGRRTHRGVDVFKKNGVYMDLSYICSVRLHIIQHIFHAIGIAEVPALDYF